MGPRVRPPPPCPGPTSATPRLPRSRPRHGCARVPAGRAGSGLAARAAAPASAPRSAPAGEGTVSAAAGLEGPGDGLAWH